MAYKDYEELNKRQQPGLRSRMGNSQAVSANQAQALRNPRYTTASGNTVQNSIRQPLGGGGIMDARGPAQRGQSFNIPNDASGRVYNRVRPGGMNINRAPGFGVGLALAGATDQMYNNPMVQGQLQTAEQGLQRQFPNYQSPFPKGQGINQFLSDQMSAAGNKVADFVGGLNSQPGQVPMSAFTGESSLFKNVPERMNKAIGNKDFTDTAIGLIPGMDVVQAINNSRESGGQRTEPLAIPPRKQGRTMPLESGNPTLLEQNYGKVNPEQAAELQGQQRGLPVPQNVQSQYNQFGYRNDDPMSLLSKEQLANMAMRKELMNEQDVIQSIRDAHNFDNYGVVPGGAPLPMPRQGLQNFYGQQEVDLEKQRLGIQQQNADTQRFGALSGGQQKFEPAFKPEFVSGLELDDPIAEQRIVNIPKPAWNALSQYMASAQNNGEAASIVRQFMEKTGLNEDVIYRLLRRQ